MPPHLVQALEESHDDDHGTAIAAIARRTAPGARSACTKPPRVAVGHMRGSPAAHPRGAVPDGGPGPSTRASWSVGIVLGADNYEANTSLIHVCGYLGLIVAALAA